MKRKKNLLRRISFHDNSVEKYRVQNKNALELCRNQNIMYLKIVCNESRDFSSSDTKMKPEAKAVVDNWRMHPLERALVEHSQDAHDRAQDMTLEALSVASECTSGTSISGKSLVDAREEVIEFAATLGLKVEELHQERFRVDRKKLEHMLLGEGIFLGSILQFIFISWRELQCW